MDENRNDISGTVDGNVVQVGSAKVVNVQNANNITNFDGPVNAPNAHFGPVVIHKDAKCED